MRENPIYHHLSLFEGKSHPFLWMINGGYPYDSGNLHINPAGNVTGAPLPGPVSRSGDQTITDAENFEAPAGELMD